MEQHFDIRQGDLVIPCVISEPDHSPARRVVLGIHGICGGKEDPIQTSIAEEMGLFGYATLRFDFPAHGESPMESGDFSLESCQRCLLAVAETARTRFPRAEEFCLFATGFGAFVTVLAMDSLVDCLGRIKLVLQSPDFAMSKTLLAMKGLTEDQFREAGAVTFQLKRPIVLRYSVYEEIREQLVYSSLPFPMLLIHGEADSLVHLEDVTRFRRINDHAQLVVIPGAEHRFLGEGQWDMVLDLTRDWFEYEQVLLCDWE